MSETWKSPRKVEEEIKQYQIDRFERQMQMVDEGKLPRELALIALREEFENTAELGVPSEQNTRV